MGRLGSRSGVCGGVFCSEETSETAAAASVFGDACELLKLDEVNEVEEEASSLVEL